jgi:hypothetical protein
VRCLSRKMELLLEEWKQEWWAEQIIYSDDPLFAKSLGFPAPCNFLKWIEIKGYLTRR